MEDTQKIEIAIDMLAGSIVDRHWNRFTHFERNTITNNVINILTEIKNDIQKILQASTHLMSRKRDETAYYGGRGGNCPSSLVGAF
jgi:hypothetical protein